MDAKDEFAEDFCLPAMRANALYMDRYPLVSALSRPLIVRHLAAVARSHKASTVSHGCTGKGNDQVRFEVGIANLAPELKVIAPVRDYAWTREKAIAYAEEKGLPIATSKSSPYSIDQNVWGRAVETGFLEDIWNGPIEDVYAYTADPAVPRDPDEVLITFEAGVPIAIDGEKVSMLQAIQVLNERAGAQGVGRLDLVEDRLVGIKSREVYEAPGAIALIAAHMELENVTIERERPLQAGSRPALGRAGLRRPVVLPTQAWTRRLHRRSTVRGVGRDPDDLACGTGDGDRSAQRAQPLRLQSRHLRRRRHLRPVPGARLHRDLRVGEQDRGPPRCRPVLSGAEPGGTTPEPPEEEQS